MNRKDIEKITAARLGVPVTTVEPFVQAFLETVSDCLMYGHHVTIQRFGSFRRWEQTSRPVRNPRTGEPCMLEPSTSVKFNPGKTLFEKMNTDLVDKQQE